MQKHAPMEVLAYGEFVLCGQFKHTPGPGDGLYWPGKQDTQSIPVVAAANPGLQRHASIAVLSSGECVFHGQNAHDALPSVDL